MHEASFYKPYKRRISMSWLRFPKYVSILAVLMMVVSLAACTAPSTAAPAGSASPGVSTPASTEVPADPLGKYDPPIEITTVRDDLGTTYTYDPGETIDNNLWYQTYEEKLGIKFKNIWVVSKDQYAQKLSAAIASDDLPDMFTIRESDFLNTLYENGLIADITDVYDRYASVLTKQINASNNNIAIKTCLIDGKMMAVPESNSMVDNALMIWIRDDWLKKLNLQTPKTMDELIAVAKAFVEQDPDGDGQADTYGIAFSKKFVSGENNSAKSDGWADMASIFYMYHAYPNGKSGFIKDASGNLVYACIQPEMKTALASLQQMYNDGLIDPEFSIKDSAKVKEDLTAGKFGISCGAMWNSISPFQDIVNADPTALWLPIPLVSPDGKPAMSVLDQPVSNWHVVNKNCEHPEALVKMQNLWVDLYFGPNAQKTVYGTTPEGKEVFKPSMFRTWIATTNMDEYLAVSAAVTAKDPSGLSDAYKAVYDQTIAYQAGDRSKYGFALVFGPGGSEGIINDIYNNNAWVTNEFYGAVTPTMAEKSAVLLKLQSEAFTKIIMNQASVDEFDNFVTQWKQLGGDQITKEVNDWYATHK
jgi:putative aldouronate transport system substrate-binding protein